MRLLAAEPLNIAGLLFSCECLCGTILVTPCSMVWDWRVSRSGPMLFYWPCCSLTFCLLQFPFLFFHSLGWCCGVEVFGLIGCSSLSPSLTLPTFHNKNNNNKMVAPLTNPGKVTDPELYYRNSDVRGWHDCLQVKSSA